MEKDEVLGNAAKSLNVTTGGKTDEGDFKTDSAMSKSPPEPTATIVGDKRLWDITDQFRTLAAALPIGTLVKDEQFTLFESVGALEIMDPKMDSGFLAPGETLVDEYDILRSILPDEVVGIMDQLLCCEMAWHEGYPLAQTLFTSHYIDKLLSNESKRLEDVQFFARGRDEKRGGVLLHTILRAYCIAMIKCCDYALDEINRSLDGGGTRVNFYEEEDFSGHTYGRELFASIPKEPIVAALYEALDCVATESMKGPTPNGVDPIWTALHDRLEFRVTLLLAMATDEPISSLGESWKEVSDTVSRQYASHKLGKPLLESFSPKIQRRLASTVPPKPMVEVSYEEAFNKLVQMCADCQEAVRIVEFGPDRIQRLKAFLWSFNSRKPEPLSYARASLSAPLFSCDDRGFEQTLRKDLEETILPADPILDPLNWTIEESVNACIPLHPKLQLANAVDRFTQTSVRMTGGYIDLYRALCSNRCRLRRNLCHVVFAYEELQMRETESLDDILHTYSPNSPQFPLSTWAYYQKLQTIVWIVQLGFELDIYLPDEVAGMYWYLSQLNESLIAFYELMLPVHKKHRAQHATLKQPARVRDASEILTTITYLESCLSFAQGQKALSSALYNLYTYLSYTHHIPDPAAASPFYTPAQRYELRMKPFLGITGAGVPAYDVFEEWIRPWGPLGSENDELKREMADCIREMEENIREAKGHFKSFKDAGAEAAMCLGVETGWGKNISSILASCVATGIAVSTLAAASSKGGTEHLKVGLPEPGKRYHDWWIVPKLS